MSRWWKPALDPVILGAGIVLGLLLAAGLWRARLPALAQDDPVHPEVWRTLAAEGSADILIVLREQADLSGAAALSTKEARGRYVYEQLLAVATGTQRDLRADLEAQGIDSRSFYVVNALQVQASGPLVHSFAARRDVARIVPNPWVRGVPHDPAPSESRRQETPSTDSVELNLLRVNADDVWAMGYTGQGIVVAGQDTGYDWDHPALKEQYRGWNGTAADHDYNWHDAIHSGGGLCGPDATQPCDDHGHGTHTMGIISGDDGAANQIGMAPGAGWIGCRNMDQGYGTPATYLECFEFFLAPYPLGGTPDQGVPDLAPHVVNNSWSCPPSEGCDAGTLEAAVEALRQAGIVVVVSAGNSGSSCSSMTDPPAIYRQSFAVGAFSHLTEQIASFSNRGPVTYGGESYKKPDLAAPGVGIRSSLVGGGYGNKSGTSMAAPHVAGAVALLLSAAPDLSGQVAAIEQTLTAGAEPRTTTQACGGDGPAEVPNNVWGWGVLDVLAAVERFESWGELDGVVTDVQSGTPIAGADVRASSISGSEGGTARTDAAGSFSLTLAANTYDVMVDAVGYIPQAIPGVVVASGQVVTRHFALSPAYRFYLPVFLVAR